MTRLATAVLVLCVVGCAAEKGAPGPHAVADVKQVMSIMLEPAAETYWDAVGTIIDTIGTEDIAPKNAEEWAEVWRAALVVAESGNLLMVETAAVRWTRDLYKGEASPTCRTSSSIGT